IVMKNPNVATAFASAGSTSATRGGGGASSSSQGGVTIHLKDGHREATQDIINDLRKNLSSIPGVRPRIQQNDIVSSLMTGGNSNVEIDIFGNDLDTLSSLSREVMRRIRNVPGIENVDVNWEEAMPEIQWQVDRQKAAQLGVAFSDIANTLNTATNGNTASYYQENGFQYPIIVQLPEAERKTIDTMADLSISPSLANATAQSVLLRQVAHPIYANGPNQITRQDRQRYIAVSGAPQGRSTGEVQADITRALADMQLPTGYYWDWGTNQKRQAEEFSGMGLAIVLAIGIIYMLLAAQFESFTHPLAILLSVPLAATGVILGLFLTGRSFGLTALIGALMLVGIVVKNGILLVDYTNTLRKRGMERNEAVLTASPTRLRPILMTASAAILGMLPIALSIGKGSEIQAPMATAVIGGLMTSTLLTLFVVPIAYTLLDDVTNRRKKRENIESPELRASLVQE
ncbi:MAG TPA: efflux RND transporter permease subunit, partial [Armatimonadota bacterium]|nr:efflux RND transporter permease subunit [Armatimonadota bacterium]